jgi:hypothetical protein
VGRWPICKLRKKILDSPQADRVKSNLLCDGVVCPKGAGSFFFWAVVHGGLGRARRLRVAASSDTAPSTCSGVDCHRPRSTKRRQERSCGVVPWTAGPNPHSRRVTSVRATFASDDAAYKLALRPPGRRSHRAAAAGPSAPLGQKCVTGLTQARAEDAYPAARAPETVLVRRSGAPPVRRLFLAPGKEP